LCSGVGAEGGALDGAGAGANHGDDGHALVDAHAGIVVCADHGADVSAEVVTESGARGG